jgi:hypothetical protein
VERVIRSVVGNLDAYQQCLAMDMALVPLRISPMQAGRDLAAAAAPLRETVQPRLGRRGVDAFKS